MKHLSITVLLFGMATGVEAGNWGHWRGDGNGASATANPPVQWSSTKNVKWKSAVPGRGSGSPIVWEDNVFVVSAVDTDQSATKEVAQLQDERRRRNRRRRDGGLGRPELKSLQFKLFCFDRATGDLIWERTTTEATPHEGTHQTNGFASASPCTDGRHVYAHFGSRGLYCYTLDGEFVWKRDDFGKMRTRATFGEGSSPTIVDNMIVVPWDHEGPSYIMALDKLTGKEIWKTPRDEPSCWATPLIVENNGQKQIVMNGQNCARSYDLETGEELWRCGGQTERPVASAVKHGDMVFVGSGFRGSFLGAFKLTGRGDIEGTENVVWSVGRDTPDIASPLLSSNRLYYHKGKSGVLTCVDAATGKAHFSNERLPSLRTIYASPIAAGGHVYLTGRSGTTIVIKDSNELEIVAENSVGEGVDATPAPVDNELFIRGEDHLFCIAKK